MPTKAINELEIYTAEIKATDRAYAQRLRGKLDELKAFNTELSNIRASFCEANGFSSSFRGMENELSGATISKAQVKFEWGYVRKVLQSPFESIRQDQFAHAAQLFVNQTTLAGQERFLNLFLEPVNLNGISNPLGVSAFTICSNKVGTVNGIIGDRIDDVLIRQGAHPYGSTNFRILEKRGDHLKQLSSFLTSIDQLTDSGQSGFPFGVQQRVILCVRDGNPIRLTEDPIRSNTNMTFNHGDIFSLPNPINLQVMGTLRAIPLPNENRSVYTPPHVSEIRSTTINIGNVMPGSAAGRDFTNSSGNSFYTRHQFNASNVMADAFIGLITLPVSAPISAGLTIAGATLGIPAGIRDARATQAGSVNLVDSAHLGNFHGSFALRSVVITNVTNPSQHPQILGWPTPNTTGSIHALNLTFVNNQDNLERILRPGATTPEVNTANQTDTILNRAFELYSALNGDGVNYFNARRQESWNAIEESITSAPNQPPNTTTPNIDSSDVRNNVNSIISER